MAMQGEMRVRIWDVQHGACAMVQHVTGLIAGRLAMIDSGSGKDFRPSVYIKQGLGRDVLDYLFITNADQDHMSDLRGLEDGGVRVETFIRNPSYSGQQMHGLKLIGGPLTRDAHWYVEACDRYDTPTLYPFDSNMGGIEASMFWNYYPTFTDTNDLSLAVFIKFNGFKILFPGDLQKPGWLALLQRPDFCAELCDTNVLVASHHGRESGYCADIFNYFTPDAVVISDKPIVHETQRGVVPDYRRMVRDAGVRVRTTGKSRHVLTTRRDGWIQFTVVGDQYLVDTECAG